MNTETRPRGSFYFVSAGQPRRLPSHYYSTIYPAVSLLFPALCILAHVVRTGPRSPGARLRLAARCATGEPHAARCAGSCRARHARAVDGAGELLRKGTVPSRRNAASLTLAGAGEEQRSLRRALQVQRGGSGGILGRHCSRVSLARSCSRGSCARVPAVRERRYELTVRLRETPWPESESAFSSNLDVRKGPVKQEWFKARSSRLLRAL